MTSPTHHGLEPARAPTEPHDPRAAPNRNHARRDEILGTAHVRYAGGVKSFAGLPAQALAQLIDEGFVAPHERQNHSPTAAEFLRFLVRWPQARAHGYAVSRRRPDYRVSIEGLECDLRTVPEGAITKLRGEFELLCRGADEYQDDGARLFAWWD
jgi:hypothetical protein